MTWVAMWPRIRESTKNFFHMLHLHWTGRAFVRVNVPWTGAVIGINKRIAATDLARWPKQTGSKIFGLCEAMLSENLFAARTFSQCFASEFLRFFFQWFSHEISEERSCYDIEKLCTTALRTTWLCPETLQLWPSAVTFSAFFQATSRQVHHVIVERC